MLVWLSIWSDVQIVSIGPADATASQTLSSLASFKYRLVLHFWYRLTQVVLEKKLLNGCSVVVVVVDADLQCKCDGVAAVISLHPVRGDYAHLFMDTPQQ